MAAKSLRLRNQYFQHSGRWNKLSLKRTNQQLATLSRVVLHPTYRGAGIAADFIRRSCELSHWPWIEVLSQLAQSNPVFEKAGFKFIGKVEQPAGKQRSRQKYSAIYGGTKPHGKQRLVSQESYKKSQYSNPLYYVFQNKNAHNSSD